MERTVEVNGRPCRVWERGEGKPIFWLGSGPMLFRWSAFHDALAEKARLVACSLPGYPGSEGHDILDDHLSWCLAARDLLEAAGFRPGDTLMGSSTAGALAADVAALWPDWVGALVLVAPFGLFEDSDPTRDMFALHPRNAASMISEDPQGYAAQLAAPEGEQPVLWNIGVVRANEAAARFLWPLGNTRLNRRLGRVKARTRVIWGAEDKIIPPSYAQRFADGIGPSASIDRIPGAGHLAELDQPAAVARSVLEFVG
ncbi:alpha/beta fold hydrolase [Phenylobacterium sp.]|uniref:alpha/beta fold hydrolase n=1 Tax=Phenylobacterium sp. TaxID=1871053 RepID=UPI0025EBA43D|nr:alpha/beta fold hydrolase [Phenylobacterium sp.]